MRLYDYDPVIEALIQLIKKYPEDVREMEVILEAPESYFEFLEDWR